ncbi:hypothetical protein O4H49_07070 [Kiloniella laminariae]|uniref:Flagellar hook-length control protein-like C-terminal domain-containing protein n=1 Tax=Kiloniella laminariae TaxID=454162 RepID=A0ABT4LHG0_9PROT|nr:hypothetical protein [Kiloniella laminariae]MCZ4280532.1 hypothetical protein [Kiloniella laminariae]
MNKVSLPLASTPSPQAGVTTQAAQVSTIANYPPALVTRPVQEQLPGTVTGQNANGQLLVQTLLGELTINSQQKLPAGTEVLLQFRTQRPPFEILLLPQTAKAAAQTPPPHHALPNDKLTLGHTLQALMLTSSPVPSGTSSLPPALAQLQPGNGFLVRVEIPPQAPKPFTSSPSPNPGTAAPTAPSTGTTPHTQATAPQSTGTGTTTVTTPSIVTTTSGTTIIQGTVTGTNQGFPVVQTPLGSIQLSIKAPITSGTSLTLTLSPQMENETSLSGFSLSAREGAPGQDLRSLLQTALTSLIHQGQGNALASHLPHQGPALTAGILLFLNALKSGSTKSWLGEDTLSLLRNSGQVELAQKLSADAPLIGQQVETAQGEWRMTPLPVLYEGMLQKANLFVRDREQGGKHQDDPDREEATRFKLEVEMSRDGDMQFDGLVKKHHFDLVVRSRNNLPRYMHQKISDIFYAANDATGYAGRISFEVSNQWEKLSEISDRNIASIHQSTLA